MIVTYSFENYKQSEIGFQSTVKQSLLYWTTFTLCLEFYCFYPWKKSYFMLFDASKWDEYWFTEKFKRHQSLTVTEL